MKTIYLLLRILSLPLVWILIFVKAIRELMTFSWYYIVYGSDMLNFYTTQKINTNKQEEQLNHIKDEVDLIAKYISTKNKK